MNSIASESKMGRLLIISHGHPNFSAGGAERAAYSLFQHMKLSGQFKKVYFMARVSNKYLGHDASLGLFRSKSDEILISLPEVDHFSCQSNDFRTLQVRIQEVLEYTRPDIVHLHHFVTFGLEIIDIIKSFGARVIFTFHEYLTICHNYGQMIKTNGRLCHSSSPLECSLCFPDITPGRFFLREKVIKHLMENTDFLISPSNFLKERFVDWGVNSDAIAVIENPLDPNMLQCSFNKIEKNNNIDKKGRNDYNRLNIGYFGQVNPFKGIAILLEAVKLLPDKIRKLTHIGIHGANFNIQEANFRAKIENLLAETSDCVHNYGSYDNSVVLTLMSNYDFVVVPSTWWENSPVVIQEAHLSGVPVLCSNIGGMMEKAVFPGDVTFQVDSPMSLSKSIVNLINDKSSVTGTVNGIEIMDLHRRASEMHLKVYQSVIHHDDQ